jgi:hypothetical protein
MIKLNRKELSEIIHRNIQKMLKEYYFEPEEYHDNEHYSSRFQEEGFDDTDTENNYNNYNNGEELTDNMSVSRVLLSYLETLILSSGEELDEYSIEDIDEASVIKSKDDILKFIKLIENNQKAIQEMNSYDEEEFGDNFALSRNSHDAGFIDDDNYILHDLAKSFGKVEIYASDNGGLSIFSSENGMTENKSMTKLKINRKELSEIVKKSINKVLKEDYYDAYSDIQQDDAQQSYYNKRGPRDISDESEEFIPHGSYTVSNSGGYEVMLSNDGDMAKVRDSFGFEKNPQTSDWLPIEYVPSEDELDDDGQPEMQAVIDPEGYNIPLNQVMKINRFNESKKMIKQAVLGEGLFSKKSPSKSTEQKRKLVSDDPNWTNLGRDEEGRIIGNHKTRGNGRIYDGDSPLKWVDETKQPKTIRIKISELREIIKKIVEEHDSTDKAIADYNDEQANKHTKNYDDAESGTVTESGKPSAGLSKGEKSGIAKKAKAGKDIGKPGKNFNKVANKAAKEYGSKEAGEKVAAAAMWKNAGK